MKPDGLRKILIVAFGCAVALYVLSFKFIQHKREGKGPWEITFQADETGVPSLLISQKALRIHNQKITFSDQRLSQTNFTQTIHFNTLKTNVPFGEVVFQDPTFLPGTIMFQFWGHGVELLPRTMVINLEAIPWNTRSNIVLTGEGKFERRPVKPPGRL